MRPIKLLLTLLLALTVSSCSLLTTEKIIKVPELVKLNLSHASPIRPVSLNKIKFNVVTKEQVEEFLYQMKTEQGYEVFIGLAIKDYEALSTNTAELYRYLNQQSEVINFYKDQVDTANNVANKPKKVVQKP